MELYITNMTEQRLLDAYTIAPIIEGKTMESVLTKKQVKTFKTAYVEYVEIYFHERKDFS